MATLTVPHPVPSAAEDAEQVREAVKGWGTNEKALIAILAHRDAAQRKHIQLAYEEMYQENLIKRLESEIHGDFERAVYRWLFEPIEREAMMANLALTKNLNYQVIVETACVNSPNELLIVKQAYHAKYRHSLEEDVAAHTGGDLRKLLVALVSTYRYGGDEIDLRLAQSEAKILQDLISQKELNHDEIIRILGTRSKAQLNATFNCYRDEFGTPIEESLSGETANEYALALHMAIRCIIDPHMYFVDVLDDALSKSGADEDTLTRVIVMHAEKDLGVIKEKFQKRKSVPLEHAVDKKTSGDYKNFILALVGN
ncbi:annexin-like protein RJ4 [Canna indica]|uniref:Annexin-like protein RJ4 n=1 Tax=Canna indica TaxID=4628 RepID=A0AAQ3JWR4_9LILI|nr:annexin-like protein RJ4 [Canna indica]